MRALCPQVPFMLAIASSSCERTRPLHAGDSPLCVGGLKSPGYDIICTARCGGFAYFVFRISYSQAPMRGLSNSADIPPRVRDFFISPHAGRSEIAAAPQ